MSSNSVNTDVEAGTGFLTKENKKDQDNTVVFAASSGRDSKLFRLFAVVMYVSMVSGLGLMLAIYHIFIWDSTMPPVAKVPGHEMY